MGVKFGIERTMELTREKTGEFYGLLGLRKGLSYTPMLLQGSSVIGHRLEDRSRVKTKKEGTCVEREKSRLSNEYSS